MPLFSSRGFNQATQAGFQQGFAATVQAMLQAKADALQRDLQGERLKAEADIARQNREAQIAAQDKQIQAEGSRLQFSESQANNRQAMDLESKKLADSQRSSDETMRFLMGQNFTADENAKQRAARASEFDITRQDSRDAAAQASMDRGEQIGLQREQIGMQKDQQKFARERATKEDTFRAADIIGKAFERKDANAQRLQEHAMSLYAGGQDSVMKAYAARAADPANPNSAADLAELKRLANASPAIIAEAAHKIAVDDAMSFIQSSDDPSIAILKDVAPDAVRSALDTHLKSATQRKTTAATTTDGEPKPDMSTGPISVTGKGTLAMTPEERAAASRGESTINVGGVGVAVTAPKNLGEIMGFDENYKGSSFGGLFGIDKSTHDKNINQSKKVAWDAFKADEGFDEYIRDGWENLKKTMAVTRGSLVKDMQDPSLRDRIVSYAFKKFWDEKGSDL